MRRQPGVDDFLDNLNGQKAKVRDWPVCSWVVGIQRTLVEQWADDRLLTTAWKQRHLLERRIANSGDDRRRNDACALDKTSSCRVELRLLGW